MYNWIIPINCLSLQESIRINEIESKFNLINGGEYTQELTVKR